MSLLQLCGLGNPSDQIVSEWKSLWQAASHRYGLRGRRLLVWCRSADKSQHRSEFIPSSPTPNAQAWLALLPLGPACQRCMRGPEISRGSQTARLRLATSAVILILFRKGLGGFGGDGFAGFGAGFGSGWPMLRR